MLTDFSVENLRSLYSARKSFLLQCPKTKVIRRVTTGRLGGHYYISTAAASGYRVVKNSSGGSVLTSFAELSGILKSKNFNIV